MMISDDLLSQIDAFMGGATYHSAVHSIITDTPPPEVCEAGFTTYADIAHYTPRSPYQRSLWVRRPSDNRCVPEIWLLAALQYGSFQAKDHGGNEVLGVVWKVPVGHAGFEKTASNVVVITSAPKRTSKYGVPAGTTEYMQRYYNDPINKARLKAASQRHQARMRARVKVAKRLLSIPSVEELARRILLPDARKGDRDDRMFDILNDPKVQSDIARHAFALLHTNYDLTPEQALTKARDAYLDSLGATPDVISPADDTADLE